MEKQGIQKMNPHFFIPENTELDKLIKLDGMDSSQTECFITSNIKRNQTETDNRKVLYWNSPQNYLNYPG